MTNKYLNNDGRFQSDKFPELAPDKIVLSFKDPEARKALEIYAKTTDNREFGDAILKRLGEIK